jgi:hypothetical protein
MFFPQNEKPPYMSTTTTNAHKGIKIIKHENASAQNKTEAK